MTKDRQKMKRQQFLSKIIIKQMENFRIQIRSLKILGSGSATLYKFYEYRGNPSTVLAVIHLIAVILSRRGSPQCDKKKLDIEISRRTNTKIFHPFFHNLKKGITAFNIINLMARIRDITFNNVKQFLANEREHDLHVQFYPLSNYK